MRRLGAIVALILVVSACEGQVEDEAITTDETVTTTTLRDVDLTAAEATAEDRLSACVICDVPDDYSGPLSQVEAQGLLLALNDEYHAWAVYDRVLADHGTVQPFANIRNAESNHYTKLSYLFEEYNLVMPDNPWIEHVDDFETVEMACAGGVEAEEINALLYDHLLSTTDREGILTTYERLQWASLERHLPAFARCGEGGGHAGGGHGNGQGNGAGHGSGRANA